jgi:tetratricopeptide (TPR) repeat protein/tRNA A-37 threonylcarbamoyl transferase component Bud32
MSTLDPKKCAGGEPSPSPLLQRLRDEFANAWKNSPASGRKSLLEAYLDRGPPAERATLQRMFEDVERSFQEKRYSTDVAGNALTMEFAGAGNVAERGSERPILDGTVVFTDPNATLDPAPMAVGGATIDPAPEADPNATIDPAPADQNAATIDPDDAQDGAPAQRPRGRTAFRPGRGGARSASTDPTAQASGQTIDYGQGEDTAGAHDTDFTLLEPGGETPQEEVIIAGHTILGELGRGGMGVVYKARQLQLNRVVALKMVLAGAHAGAEQLARFQTEAEAVARLKHPNIVQIYEVGEHDDLPFFSLEYVDGGSLAQRIAGKPQPPHDAARMVERLADAMDSAHRQNIIHRDLKPANILLTHDGDPKITDFGLAKRLEGDSKQTRSGTLMGTPSYMAPEQAHGDTKNIGPLSDLYALGTILYEMLTGRPPFQGTTILETLDLVQKQEPVPPRRLQPTVPRDLETICLKCLQKEPQKRYATASALAADLLRFLGGEAILARRVGRVERLWRWCKRNPKVAALSASVAALVVTVGVFLVSSYFRAAREQEVIDKERQLAEVRLEQATTAIRAGDQRQAQVLLESTNPLLESTEQLRDIRDRLADRRSQVEVYSEFKKLVDDARFASRFGSRRRKLQAQQQCRQLVALHEQIKERTGKGAAGLPPLNPEQEQLFKEDVFEAYLIAALLEAELFQDARGRIQPEAAPRAMNWLNQADAILPGTRVVHANRAPCWGALGDAMADERDVKRAKEIVPTLAVDHFYHGFAHHLRANAARSEGKVKDAEASFRKEIDEYAAVLQIRQDSFWAYFNWAATQFDLGNLRDAQIGFTACIRIRPDFPWPFNNRGTIHHRLGENDQAVQDYDKAVALDAEYVEAYTNRGLAQLRLGKTALAEADLEKAIQLSPDYAPAYEYLAEVHYSRKDYAATINDYTRLLPLTAAKSPVYLKRATVNHQLGYHAAAVADCTQVLAENAPHAFALYMGIPLSAPDSWALRSAIGAAFNASGELARTPQTKQALYDRAGYQLNRKKYAEAAEDYTSLLALSADKDKVAVYLKLASVRRDMGRPDQAIEDCTRALKLDAKNPQALYARAHYYFDRKDYARARDDFSALLAMFPKSAPTRIERGILNWVFLRDFDASLVDWHELKKLQPKNPQPHYNAGVIYLGRRQYAEAVGALQMALNLKPDHSDAAAAMAQAWGWQGDWERALGIIGPFTEKFSTERPETLAIRGGILRALGRLDEAATDFRRLIELKPDWPETYVSLALVYEQQNKANLADECYEKLVAANPASARAYLRRAEFHRAHGRFDAALADCGRAREKDAKSVLPGLVEATVLAARGADEDAITKAEGLLTHAPKDDGQVLYTAACVWSLASAAATMRPGRPGAGPDLAKKYADRAIEFLEQCLDKGFHDLLYPEHNRMTDDPALQSIRRQPRVRALFGVRG